MSRQQVSAVRQHGPYTYVRVTGGLETRNGFWAQHKKHTSFVFKGDSLWRVQLWMYRGRDLDTALKQWVDLYRHMSATYGPVSFPEIKTTGDYDAELVERLFRSTLEPLATATRGQSATAVVKFHMTPKTSPTAKRVSAMLAYHSKFGYYVMFMHDQPRPVTRL